MENNDHSVYACDGCDKIISLTSLVRYTESDTVYHVECFTCAYCLTIINDGDPYYPLGPKKLMCHACYAAGQHGVEYLELDE